MNKRQNTSARASALQITLFVALVAVSAILSASSFRASPQAASDGFYPPLPGQKTTEGGCPTLPITLSLPNDYLDPSVPASTVIIAPVTTTLIDSTTTNGANITGCQGDFTFDSSVITFANPPVQRAGLTSDPNWNVSANIIGTGTIKTLRISAFMGSFVGLNGSGTCFEVRIRRVSSTVGAMSPLTWAPLCGGNEFILIDDNLDSYDPTQNNGLVAIQGPPVNIDGTIIDCSNPVSGPVPNVALTVTGGASGSTSSDSSGNYLLSGLPSGGTYTVTPSKAPLAPGSSGINTVDVIAVQRHFLGVTPLTGCRLAAADVNGDGHVDTIDVTAINRFYLGQATGIGNTGRYKFIPISRTYSGVLTNQTAQNYDTLVFGDVASAFVHRPEGGPSQDAGEAPATVAAVALPNVAVDTFVTNFITQVRTSAIDAKNKLVGFQGDLTFDERVVTFQSDPVQRAGLTASNWNVSGNVLPGKGPIRTLRISAYSNDFAPLSGEGVLFELNMTRLSKAAQGTQLTWAVPPDHFIFIDADLNTQQPINAAPGSVTPSGKRK